MRATLTALLLLCTAWADAQQLTLEKIFPMTEMPLMSVSATLQKEYKYVVTDLAVPETNTPEKGDSTVFLQKLSGKNIRDIMLVHKYTDGKTTVMFSYTTFDSLEYAAGLAWVRSMEFDAADVNFQSSIANDPLVFEKGKMRVKTFWARYEDGTKYYVMDVIRFPE
ncbi:MAG: hypothetical protein R2794_10980 [Chitinophagales bacterium]